MKRIWWAAAAACSVMTLVACSADEASSFDSGGRASDSGKGGEFGGGGTSGAVPSGGGDPSSGGSSSGSSGSLGKDSASPGGSSGQAPQSGLLTAGVWDDNLNFDFFQKYLTLTGAPEGLGVPSFSPEERNSARVQFAQRTGKNELDLTFLLDTTGSMGDELRYLQQEINGIASTLAAKHPQLAPRFNLVVYRDRTDDYVARSFQWGTGADLKRVLDQQSVNGGGDYEEAVEEGLAAATKLEWRAGANVARMVFWVADAPHHAADTHLVHDAIVAASQKDVHIYPVAASGADDRTEYTMRTAAQMTGGRYVFLTDDSGIGNDHAEPMIPCYEVTRFDGALVRMVESELAGQRVAPTPEQVIRRVGNPTNGTCTTQSSGNVTIY